MSQKSMSSVKKVLINLFRFLHILISFGHKLREELTLVFFQFRQTCVQFKRWCGYELMEVDYGYWWTNRSDLVVVYYKQCRIVLELAEIVFLGGRYPLILSSSLFVVLFNFSNHCYKDVLRRILHSYQGAFPITIFLQTEYKFYTSV